MRICQIIKRAWPNLEGMALVRKIQHTYRMTYRSRPIGHGRKATSKKQGVGCFRPAGTGRSHTIRILA